MDSRNWPSQRTVTVPWQERHVRATTDFLVAKNVEIENAVNDTWRGSCVCEVIPAPSNGFFLASTLGLGDGEKAAAGCWLIFLFPSSKCTRLVLRTIKSENATSIMLRPFPAYGASPTGLWGMVPTDFLSFVA